VCAPFGRSTSRWAAAATTGGRTTGPGTLHLYRLRWQLDDLANFVHVLRATHRQTADTEHALRSLARSMPEEDG
jgi:spectinomycin phosphotransferase